MAKQNLIIGGSINYGINQLKPWVLSAKEIATHNTDIVLICGNTSKETIEWLDKQGVFTVDLIQVPNIPIHVLRFLSIYDYLKDNWLNYNHVITTDVKDVYFQTDPFEWLDYHNIGVKDMKQLVAGAESIRYKDESWGNQNLMETYGGYIYSKFKDNEIYNVGVLAGSSEYIKDLVFNIFSNATNRPIPIVDQAVYNVLIQTQPYKNVIHYTKQHEAWAVQAGTVADPSKIDGFRPNLTDLEPVFRDGIVSNSLGKPFCIVHQYDRVPEWKEFVQKKFKQDDPSQLFTYKV